MSIASSHLHLRADNDASRKSFVQDASLVLAHGLVEEQCADVRSSVSVLHCDGVVVVVLVALVC